MKAIPLSNGGSAIVDDADFDMLNNWKWKRSCARTLIQKILDNRAMAG